MTSHLSSQEFVDALDHTLGSTRQQHLHGCERCQAQVVELQSMMDAVESGAGLPEPSPLFWEHFSARVRVATSQMDTARGSWWTQSWRPITGLAAVLTAVLLVVVLRQEPFGPSANRSAALSGAPVAAPAPAAEDESLNFVARLTTGVSFEELRQAARPTEDATDALVAQLSPEQRAELVRLLKAGEGSSE